MKKLRRTILPLLLATAGTMLSGCYACWDQFDSFGMGVRDRCSAHMAWWRCRDVYSDCENGRHFGCGFRQGYMDGASGSNNCLPATPPRSYWGMGYQSPTGRGRVNSWYEGYSHGSLVASQDGVGYWNEIGMMKPDGFQDRNARHEVYTEESLRESMLPEPEEPSLVPPVEQPAPAPSFDSRGYDPAPSLPPQQLENQLKPNPMTGNGDNPFSPFEVPDVEPLTPEALPNPQTNYNSRGNSPRTILPSGYSPSTGAPPAGYRPGYFR